MDKDISRYITKSLSLILRHNAAARRVDIDAEGFAHLSEVLDIINENPKAKSVVSLSQVLEAVEDDGKKRFQVTGGPDGMLIRAMSGHSFEVDIPGEDFKPEGPLWFGTDADAIERIQVHGLLHSAKLKVRLSRTIEAAERIASERKGGPLVIEVDAERLYSEGWRFSLIANGEVLTDRFGREYCTIRAATGARP